MEAPRWSFDFNEFWEAASLLRRVQSILMNSIWKYLTSVLWKRCKEERFVRVQRLYDFTIVSFELAIKTKQRYGD